MLAKNSFSFVDMAICRNKTRTLFLLPGPGVLSVQYVLKINMFVLHHKSVSDVFGENPQITDDRTTGIYLKRDEDFPLD